MELAAYLPQLATTIGVELSLACALAPRGTRAGVAAAALFLKLTTHPLATLALTACGERLAFAAVELVVAGVEALGYWLVAGLRLRRALVLAAVANGVTALLSFLPLWSG